MVAQSIRGAARKFWLISKLEQESEAAFAILTLIL